MILRSICAARPAAPRAARHFTASGAALKKKTASPAGAGGGSSSAAAAPSAGGGGGGFNAAELKKNLDETLKSFGEKVKEARVCSVSTERFAGLAVDLGHDAKAPLKTLATIAARGNKVNIVAFDPKQVKRIQTAVVAQLGVPAEPGKDQQTLTVSVPQQTEAKKAAAAKLIKDAFESLRNNAANRHSLASIRARYLAPLKKAATKNAGVAKDDVRRQTQEIEQLVKDYTAKLQEQYRKSA